MDLTEKNCLVVGGGNVAERKLEKLLDACSKVTVISPHITERISKLVNEGKISYKKRKYSAGDLKDVFIAFVCTDDHDVSRLTYEESRKTGTLVNIADDPKLCDFFVPAVVKEGDLKIAVSTGGKSPGFAKEVRERIEKILITQLKSETNAVMKKCI